MHKVGEDALKRRGWSDDEVSHARNVFLKAAEDRPLEKKVFWALLVMGVLGVIVFSAYFVPLAFVLPGTILYPLLVLFGLLFGALFTIVMRDLHWLSKAHHDVAHLFLVGLAILSIVLTFSFAGSYEGLVPQALLQAHNPLVVGLFFALSLTTPYLYESHKNRR